MIALLFNRSKFMKKMVLALICLITYHVQIKPNQELTLAEVKKHIKQIDPETRQGTINTLIDEIMQLQRKVEEEPSDEQTKRTIAEKVTMLAVIQSVHQPRLHSRL
jgi:dsRNA-specific ribonuclease